jgi:hypothetical protein
MATDGIIFSKDREYCLETDDSITNLVDVILDKQDADGVEIAAKWLCSTVFVEFAHVKLDMKAAADGALNDLAHCGQHVVRNEWNVASAVQFVVGSPHFYSQLGKKLAAPMTVAYGAVKDFDLNLSDKHSRQMFSMVGRAPYQFRDVNGYEDELMTDKTLTGLHKIFDWHGKRYFRNRKQFPVNDFQKTNAKKQKFTTNFAAFMKEDGNVVSYALHHDTCPDTYVEIEDSAKDQEATVDQIFYSHSKWRNWRKWRDTTEAALGNPCEFLC